MKQIYLIILLSSLISAANVNAQVTITGSAPNIANGTIYTTLTGAGGAFAAINAINNWAGYNIVLTINNNITETGANGLNQPLTSTWTSLTINPNGARTVSGNYNGNMIRFNGADNVTINGLNTGGNSLIISNVNTGAAISTIRFINDARNNTITNCTILGSSTSVVTAAGGTILFSTGTTNGNDNNTISYCNIGPAGGNLPTKGIMSLGSTGTDAVRNSTNNISNNNIYNFFAATISSSGIYIYDGNDDWTISSNRLYQTGTRSFSNADLRYAGISLNTVTRPGKFNVSNNIIGFASATETGETTINGSVIAGRQNEIRGIDAIAVNTTTATLINGNKISGFNQVTSRRETPLVNSCFIGIALGTSTAGGLFQCGTSTGNTIGSLDGSSSIIINGYTTTDGTSPVMGILDLSSQNNNISNNNVGTVTINITSGGSDLGFTGIYINTVNGATASTAFNTIGGATTATGITDNHTGNYAMYGIYIEDATALAVNNTIRNMSGNSSYANTIISSGIICTGSTGNNTVSNNIVHSLSNESGSANNSIYAIVTEFPSTTNTVNGNNIHSLYINSTNKNAQLVGIENNSTTTGTQTFSNNMIRLGYTAAGASITGGYNIVGIWEEAGKSDLSYNSVYIGGTNVASVSNTMCYYSNVNTVRNCRNNIFHNARLNASGTFINYAIRIDVIGTNLTSNYNDLLAEGDEGYIGSINGTFYQTFTDWQATGKDANSFNVTPQFINPTGDAATGDLHLQNYSPLNALATPITGITTDYDADTRDVTTPDIGADEIVGVSNMVTVTATAGVVGPTNYANVRNAFNAINNGTHQGAITVSINANTYEVAQAVLNRTGSGSANYTSVNVRPVNDGLTVNSNLGAAAIKFNNATNVTLDGDNPNTGGTNRNLSIINSNATTPSVIWIGGSTGNAANNVTLKNCIITNGTQTSTAIVVSDATTIGNAGYFTNITIDNNLVQKAYIGAYVIATVLSGNGNGLTISNNSLNSTGANAIRLSGIYVQGVDGATVSNNTVSNINNPNSEQTSGIWLALNTKNSTISGNTVSSLSNTYIGGPYGLYPIFVTSGENPANISISGNIVTNISNASLNIAGGILVGGTNTSGVTVSNNTISNISYTGTGSGVAYALYANTGNAASNIIFTGNTVAGVTSAGTGTNSGLIVGGATGGVTIQKNSFSNIKNTNTVGYGCNGIWLGSSLTASNINVNNNFIFDVASYGYPLSGIADNGYGIVVSSGGGYNIDFNTVHLNTNQTQATSLPACINITSGVTTSASINLRNNIFSNTQTVGTNRYCIYSGATNAVYGSINYNDYYTAGPNLGYIGSNRANLAAIIAGFGGNANSITFNPVYISATNLHLTAGSNYALKAGNFVTGITTDIDGDLRNQGLPAIGADEYHIDSLWSGNVNTIWNVGGNWDNGIMPNSASNVIIPFGVPNMPVLDANRTVNDLKFIKTGTPFFVDINGKTFTINGTITGTGTLTGSSTSNLVLNGTTGTVNFTQTSDATRSLNNLTLGASGTATIGNDLIMYGNVQVNNTAANAMNFNGQSITLKSNVNNTATIDKLNTAGSNLTGATNVTVERWIPLRLTGGTGSGNANNGRAYRVLTSTVSSGTATINASWQEGLKNTVIGVYNVPPAPYQNFGTHITGAGGSANGFDITQTNESSLYTFTNGSNINSTLGYPSVPNTNILIDGQKGYFMYIRGDRNVSTQLPYQPAGGMPTSSTTLRAKGSVLKGNITYTISATNGDFSLITNPYPAPLDWDLVSTGNTNINSTYTFWNSNTGIRGAFEAVLTGSSTHRYIQPGEGFFVQKNGTGGGTVTITEAMKAVGNNDNTVFFTEHTPFESFRVSLFLTEANNVRHTADDVLVRYDNNYSAAVDYDDAEEITNWNENIAISRGGTRLAIESRPVITDKDTIPLHIKNLRKTNYDFELTPSLFSNTNLMAELIDNYLHTRTTLSVVNTVTVPFTVNNDAASFATDRFMIVFSKPSGPLPIDMSSIKAYEKNSGIQVDWVMNSEQDMDKYEVEKSTDGRHFVKTGTVLSKGNSNIQVNYGWFDANPAFGDNFYRVKSIEKAGTYKYSDIVRVNIGKGISTGISMYPNPFEGNGFNLQMNKFAAGTYTLTMYNSLGQQVYNTTLTHGGGSATQFISLGKDLAAGTYTVKINGEGTTLTRTITKK